MPANAGDAGPVPGSGRYPGEGNGNPLQYFCVGNPIDRGTWYNSPWGHKWVDTTYWLNNNEASLNFFYKWIVDRWISLLCSSISFSWSLISFSSTSLILQFLSVFIEFWKRRLTQCKIDERYDIYFRQRVDHPPLYGVIFILFIWKPGIFKSTRTSSPNWWDVLWNSWLKAQKCVSVKNTK